MKEDKLETVGQVSGLYRHLMDEKIEKDKYLFFRSNSPLGINTYLAGRE
jgi:hypothetical protein